MADDVHYEYGVDINSSCSFKDGDLDLSRYDENLGQAIANRLNTELDELDVLYDGYGSVLSSFLGWRRNDETLRLVKLEIDNCLSNDPRLSDFKTEVSFNDSGALVIEISIYPYTTSYNFILTNEGVSLE